MHSMKLEFTLRKCLETVKKWVPITHAAFLDYRVGAAHLSSKGSKNCKIDDQWK